MKELLFIKDTLANKISYFHVMLLLTCMPFDQFYSHIVFASLFLHTLIYIKKGQLKELFTIKNLVLQSIFFLTICTFAYTAYIANALTDVTRYLLIFSIPICFSLNTLNFNKYKHQLLLAFSISNTITIIYLYVHAFNVIRYYKLPVSYITSESFISHNFSAPINIHATFFSMQIALAFFYLIWRIIKGNTKNKALYFAAIVFLFAGIIQLGSKSILASLLLAINIAVPYFLIERHKLLKYLTITLTFTLLIVIGTLSINSFKTRYITDLKTDLSGKQPNEVSDSRLVRWEAAMQLAAQSPWVGYGAGSEIEILHEKFFSQKLYSAFLHHLNAHNQYISFVLVAGITGLLVYLIVLWLGFNTAIVQKDMLFFVFVLLMAVVSLSESLLNAEKGVYFYSLFFSFFVYSSSNKSIYFLNKKL